MAKSSAAGGSAGSNIVQEILDLRSQLEARDASRNASYDEILLNYGGSNYRDRLKQGYFPGIKSVSGQVFNSRPDEEDAQELDSPINFIKPAILNKISFLALVPQPRVIEPPDSLFTDSTDPQTGAVLTAADQAMSFADELEQIILGLWKSSNIVRRCWDLAWNLGVFGGSVVGVWPDMRKNRPRIFTRSPQYFYPVSIDEDGLELDRCLWVDKLNGYDIQARWQNPSYAGRTDVEVTQYIDTEKMCIIVDNNELVVNVPNPLGLVPVVCVGSIGVPGSVFGDTEVTDALPIAKELNYHVKLLRDMSSGLVQPTIAIKDPMNVPEDVAIGRGGVITMGAQGSVQLLGPMNLPPAFWTLNETLQGWFDMVADNPAQLRGEGIGSVLTGKGFNASLSPVSARLQTRLNLILAAWEQVNRYLLLMWKNFPSMNKLKVAGAKGKNMFYLEKKPADFTLAGEIWTENEVVLSSSSFIDRQGTDVELIQLGQNEYISWETVVENLPYVQNKKRERARIDHDRLWKAQGVALANQVSNSPMTANVDPGAQERTAYGLQQGFTGEVGAPPAPTAVMPKPGQAPPMGGPSPAGANPVSGGPAAPTPAASGPGAGPSGPTTNVMSVLEQVFKQIGKLKGAVWIGGDPLLNPDSTKQANWKLTVWVENPQDQGTITRFVKNRYPELYGHLTFLTGAPSPQEPNIQVAGGSAAPSAPAGGPQPGGSPGAQPSGVQSPPEAPGAPPAQPPMM